jgi:hypothetical protein
MYWALLITHIYKLKLQLFHYMPWRCLGKRYSSYSFSTSALDGGWAVSVSPWPHFSPREKGPPVPTVREAGWAPDSVWTQRLEEKSFRLCRGSNLEHPVIQPVARHYTDGATWLTIIYKHQWQTESCLKNIDIRDLWHSIISSFTTERTAFFLFWHGQMNVRNVFILPYSFHAVVVNNKTRFTDHLFIL